MITTPKQFVFIEASNEWNTPMAERHHQQQEATNLDCILEPTDLHRHMNSWIQ